MNHDCWYLYTLNPLEGENNKKQYQEPDQTLEILMSDLDLGVMSIFTREESSSAAEATQVSMIMMLPLLHKSIITTGCLPVGKTHIKSTFH
jgi:hypothetical protein